MQTKTPFCYLQTQIMTLKNPLALHYAKQREALI